jgi:excisionase family DNA binding protein
MTDNVRPTNLPSRVEFQGREGPTEATARHDPRSSTMSDQPPTNADLAPLLNITQVADALGVEVRHVRRLVHERRIPYIKWGHLLRFDPRDVTEWLRGCRREPMRRP